MVMIHYYSYNCNCCGKATQHQLFVLKCQNCGFSLCKKCAKGSLCLNCYNSLPEELQKKYSRQLNTPKIIIIIILLAIFTPIGILIPQLLLFLVLLGVIAYCMDHGKYKTTPRSAVRKAQKIVTEARLQFQSTPQPSQNLQQKQQKKYQQQDPESKYDGTFWDT